MKWILRILVLTLLFMAQEAQAHEVRPAYLEVKQTSADRYVLLFKVPALGEDYRLGIYLKLPENVRDVTPPQASFEGGAHLERRNIEVPGGLDGKTIAIDGLQATMTDALARVEHPSGIAQVERLTPTRTSFTVAASRPALESAYAAWESIGYYHHESAPLH